MNALCIIATSGYFRHIRSTVQSAIKHLQFDHVFLALPPHLESAGWHVLVEKMLPEEVHFSTHIIDDRSVTLNMLHGASENISGWVFVCHDSATISTGIDTDNMPDNVAMFHSGFLSVCMEETSMYKIGDIYPQISQKLQRCIDGNMFSGSFFGYRASALQKIDICDVKNENLESSRDEWLLAWHMLNNGYSDCYLEAITHIQRTNTATYEARSNGRKRRWAKACEELDKNYPSSNRYWQNWDRATGVEKVEDFWLKDKNQHPRRGHLYSVLLDRVVPTVPDVDLLDVGCGICLDKPALEEMGFCYHGSDVTKEMLKRAKEKHPNVDVFWDDIIHSDIQDRLWPAVICSAVIPHLPISQIPSAISNLWRITKTCLIVRVFGVDIHKTDETLIMGGYVYQQLTEKTWTGYFNALNARAMEIAVGSEESKDVRIYMLWR